MNRIIAAALAALLVIGLAACSSKPVDAPLSTVTSVPEPSASYLPALTAANETPTGWTQTPITIPTPEPTPEPWTAEDVAAIARTLSGECYDDKPADKRLVCEVILNRVCNGYWGDTVISVITANGQFYGYWYTSREVTVSDLEIAEETLRDWYAGGCEPLSEYLCFESGPNRENVFRAKY
jgi:hypothetical protein